MNSQYRINSDHPRKPAVNSMTLIVAAAILACPLSFFLLIVAPLFASTNWLGAAVHNDILYVGLKREMTVLMPFGLATFIVAATVPFVAADAIWAILPKSTEGGGSSGTREYVINPRTRSIMTWLLLISLPIYISSAMMLFVGRYYISSDGIHAQEYPWSSFQQRRWSDVRAVSTSCSHVRERGGAGYWAFNYSARLDNGQSFLLNESHFDVEPSEDDQRIARKLSAALAPLRIQFSREDIESGCRVPNIGPASE